MNTLAMHGYTILIIIVALVGGAAVGALIHAAIHTYQNRLQPIGRRYDVFPKFEDLKGASCLRTNLTFSDSQKQYQYDQLQIVQIQLSNQGDKDLERFEFGMTLSEGDVAIYIESQSPDRHHQVEQITSLSCADAKSEIDLILHPFNKTDTYSLRLLMITAEPNKEPGEIKFSSPEAVKFVDLPTTKEVIENAARSASLSFGPFSISLGG
jgi:hypothetical protein